jgi:hypothetical protein
MKTKQVAHIRRSIAALSIGATLTVAACAQDALTPSYPSQAPPRSKPVVTVPVPPAQSVTGGAAAATETGTATGEIAIAPIGPQPQSGGGLVTVPTEQWNVDAPPQTATKTATSPPIGDVTLPEPPVSESTKPPAIIGNETPDPGPVDGE